MNYLIIIAFAPWLAGITLFTEQDPYRKLEAGSGEILFRIKNAGIWVDGQLSELKIDGVFDPDKPEDSALKATVSVATMDTGIGMRDNHLMREKYFDQANYPKITIASERIRREKDRYFFEGQLQMKDVTHPVSFPFTAQPEDNALRLEGTFSLDRLDYHIGSKSLILGRTVEITISCKLLP